MWLQSHQIFGRTKVWLLSLGHFRNARAASNSSHAMSRASDCRVAADVIAQNLRGPEQYNASSCNRRRNTRLRIAPNALALRAHEKSDEKCNLDEFASAKGVDDFDQHQIDERERLATRDIHAPIDRRREIGPRRGAAQSGVASSRTFVTRSQASSNRAGPSDNLLKSSARVVLPALGK
jgi:hypothetical protein